MSRSSGALPVGGKGGSDHLVGILESGRGGTADVRVLAGALASLDGHRPGAVSASLVVPLLGRLLASQPGGRAEAAGRKRGRHDAGATGGLGPAAKRSAAAGSSGGAGKAAAGRAAAAAEEEEEEEEEEGEVSDAADAWFAWPLGPSLASLRELTALFLVPSLSPRLRAQLLGHGWAAGDVKGGPAGAGAAGGGDEGGPARTMALELPDGFVDGRLGGLNASQREAAVRSLTEEGVTLVQGPPGTGKTTTVLAVLNCAHMAGLQRWREVMRRGEACVAAERAGVAAEADAGLAAAEEAATAAAAARASARAAERGGPLSQAAGGQSSSSGRGAASMLGSLLAGVGRRRDDEAAAKRAEEERVEAAARAREAEMERQRRAAAGEGDDDEAAAAEAEEAARAAVERAARLLELRERLRLAAAGRLDRRGRGSTPRHRGLALWLLRGGQDEASLLQAARSAVADRPRILVCTHSNAAVDNILQRIVARGPADGPPFLAAHAPPGGGPPVLSPYNPPVLRVGSVDKSSPGVRASGVLLAMQSDALLATPHAALTRDAAALRQRCDAIRASLRATRRAFRADLGLALAALGPTAGACAVVAAADERVLAWAERLLITIEDWQRAAAALERLDWAQRATGPASGVDRRGATEAVQWSLLDDADVVFSTLSSAAVSAVEAYARGTGRGFATVVVDEAAQAPEASTLIPLQYGCRRCVLVGDPQQLPATVISPVAARLGLDRSLFARLQACGGPVSLLDEQHRMHPDVSAFPSARFYGGRVRDAAAVRGEGRAQGFHDIAHFQPFLFFDCRGGGRRDGRSYSNDREAALAAALVASLMRWRGSKHVHVRDAASGAAGRWVWESRVFTGSVAVLTPYQGQVRAIHAALEAEYARANADGSGGPALPTLQPVVSTVDSAQGREFDVVVVSAVRSAGSSAPQAGEDERSARKRTIGFVKDQRRLNVALTRGRFAVWVVGDAPTLAGGSKDWAGLVEHARERGMLVPAEDAEAAAAAVRRTTADAAPQHG